MKLYPIISTRPGVNYQIADDAVRIIYDHLLNAGVNSDTKVDLFLHSFGGAGVVPWKLVNLIREFSKKFDNDTIVVYWMGAKRYIITAIDTHSKIAFARMYSSKHSKHAKDFLLRLNYLMENKIENFTRDNSSEFQGEFAQTLADLSVGSYYSRLKTPTDNPYDERFNRTLQEEFIQIGNLTSDCEDFNKKLTEWLIEYNFHRPHQALDYETPIEFHYNYHKVLSMYPASTFS